MSAIQRECEDPFLLPEHAPQDYCNRLRRSALSLGLPFGPELCPWCCGLQCPVCPKGGAR